jgi:hypothetical protein
VSLSTPTWRFYFYKSNLTLKSEKVKKYSDTISQDFPFFRKTLILWRKACCLAITTTPDRVERFCLKQQTSSLIKSKFSEKNGKSSYIWLDKFPNEQFKQTFGTTSQNGLKVSLFHRGTFPGTIYLLYSKLFSHCSQYHCWSRV